MPDTMGSPILPFLLTVREGGLCVERAQQGIIPRSWSPFWRRSVAVVPRDQIAERLVRSYPDKSGSHLTRPLTVHRNMNARNGCIRPKARTRHSGRTYGLVRYGSRKSVIQRREIEPISKAPERGCSATKGFVQTSETDLSTSRCLAVARAVALDDSNLLYCQHRTLGTGLQECRLDGSRVPAYRLVSCDSFRSCRSCEGCGEWDANC